MVGIAGQQPDPTLYIAAKNFLLSCYQTDVCLVPAADLRRIWQLVFDRRLTADLGQLGQYKHTLNGMHSGGQKRYKRVQSGLHKAVLQA